jgi:hypothetical protein
MKIDRLVYKYKIKKKERREEEKKVSIVLEIC